MTAPDFAILVYGPEEALSPVVDAIRGSDGIVIHHMPENAFGWTSQGEPLILLGVGADGCAALARRVEEGLEGVAAVVLIGPEAPWAGDTLQVSGRGGLRRETHNLGPLEPLRAVAERARRGTALFSPRADYNDGPDSDEIPWPPDSERTYPLRLVIAAHPERAACGRCKGQGWRCDLCSGSGSALGPAEVARELGDMEKAPDPLLVNCTIQRGGAMFVLSYPTRAALEELAIREALAIAMERP